MRLIRRYNMCSFLHSFQAKYFPHSTVWGRDANTVAAGGAELPSSGWKDNTVNTWAGNRPGPLSGAEV